MLIPAFELHLKNTVLTGLVCVGKCAYRAPVVPLVRPPLTLLADDGKHPSLTCATSAGKVFLHSPHEQEDADKPPIRFLNINRRITAMAAGALKPGLSRELVLVGTPTSLMAYDVEENSDLFFKDIPDGVNALIFGRVPGIEPPLAVVGGNCSIQGFDHEGNEVFWTVTGDNVTSLSFCDVENDGVNELLVGSEDHEIRIFQQEDVRCPRSPPNRHNPHLPRSTARAPVHARPPADRVGGD